MTTRKPPTRQRRSDRYDLVDDKLQAELASMTPAELAAAGYPAGTDRSLAACLRIWRRRAIPLSYGRISQILTSATGVSVSHETVRRWCTVVGAEPKKGVQP